MTITREFRESILTVLGPVPYIGIFLVALSLSSNIGPVTFLFVFSLTITFIYLLIAQAVESVQSNLSQQRNTVPTIDKNSEWSTYSERFIAVSREALFGIDSDTEAIIEYTSPPLFPYLVYSFWGFVTSLLTFLFSGSILAWLVNSGNLSSMADLPASREIVQNAPLGLLDFLLAIFPVLDGLSFKDQVLVGGVTFFTGFMFLSAARNLTEVSDDIHRHVLRFLVIKNPLFKNEFLNALIIAGIYGLLFQLT